MTNRDTDLTIIIVEIIIILHIVLVNFKVLDLRISPNLNEDVRVAELLESIAFNGIANLFHMPTIHHLSCIS